MSSVWSLLLRPDAASAVFVVSVGLLAYVVALALGPPPVEPDRLARSPALIAKPAPAVAPRFVREGRHRDG